MPRFFNPQSFTKQGFRISAAFAGSATLFLFVMAIMASPAAEAQVVRHTTVTPRPGVSHKGEVRHGLPADIRHRSAVRLPNQYNSCAILSLCITSGYQK